MTRVCNNNNKADDTHPFRMNFFSLHALKTEKDFFVVRIRTLFFVFKVLLPKKETKKYLLFSIELSHRSTNRKFGPDSEIA